MSALPDLTAGHLDAIEAQLRLALVQLHGLRLHLGTLPPARKAAVDLSTLPDACRTVPAKACGHRNEEVRQSIASMANPQAWRCATCRLDSDGPGVVSG